MVTYVRVQGYISYDGWFIEEGLGSFPHPFLPHILILAIYFRCAAMIHLLIIFLLLFVFTKNSESSSPLSSSFSHLISFNFFMYLSVPLKFWRFGMIPVDFNFWRILLANLFFWNFQNWVCSSSGLFPQTLSLQRNEIQEIPYQLCLILTATQLAQEIERKEREAKKRQRKREVKRRRGRQVRGTLSILGR